VNTRWKELLILAAMLVLVGAQHVVAADNDSFLTDPSTIDAQNPPGIAEVTIVSGGAKMNGIIYLAPGAGPHATVVFLHGYPGNERNLDLAQAVRRVGFNALYFNYRGSWGSGGTFSWANTVEDANAAVQFLRSPEVSKRHRIDPDHIILVGHSVGGWTALMSAAADQKLVCVGYLAGYNLGRAGQLMRENEKLKTGLTDYFNETTDPQSGPIRAASGRDLSEQLMADPKALDVTERVQALRRRPVLLVSGAKDSDAETAQHHEPLVKALKEAGAERVKSIVFDSGDHAFSGYRIALAIALVQWLKSNCSP
jgi:uncharacterized protein